MGRKNKQMNSKNKYKTPTDKQRKIKPKYTLSSSHSDTILSGAVAFSVITQSPLWPAQRAQLLYKSARRDNFGRTNDHLAMERGERYGGEIHSKRKKGKSSRCSHLLQCRTSLLKAFCSS
mmetsp:Transcript_28160/g.71794  ORF Transcript_28160/g.71794 Transcript_28160/m.71794 type:complete len:120 (-) Transcript_28160:1774-2133(-)